MQKTRALDGVRWIYERKAPVYDLIYRGAFERGRQIALKAMNPKPGQKILEVGAGTGLSFRHYPNGVRLSGIDLSKPMLDRAKARAKKMGLKGLDLRVMDGQAMEYKDDSFEQVVAMYVVSVAPDPAKMVAEMRRVCRPGGRLTVVNHLSDSGGWRGFARRLLGPLEPLLGFRPLYGLEDFLAGSAGLNWNVLHREKGLTVLQAVNP